jgi:hypothetical protein
MVLLQLGSTPLSASKCPSFIDHQPPNCVIYNIYTFNTFQKDMSTLPKPHRSAVDSLSILIAKRKVIPPASELVT